MGVVKHLTHAIFFFGKCYW